MEILIATGRLAENTVRKAAGEKADVLVADIDIAAFITPKKLTRAFEEAGFYSQARPIPLKNHPVQVREAE